MYVLKVTTFQICKIHQYYINLQILRNKSAYHYNLNNPFDHNTVSNRSIYTLNKQIWPFTLVHGFEFKNFIRSMRASLDKYLLRSLNYISSRDIEEILFFLSTQLLFQTNVFFFAILRLLSYHYEIEINFYNDNFPHSVSDIIYCSKLVPHYILAKNRQAGKTVRLSLNLGEGHGT